MEGTREKFKRKFQSYCKKLKKTTLTNLLRKYLYSRYSGPINILEKDWDNLIILDACRYDIFAEINTLPGELDYQFSNASATMEWVQNSIGDREFHDTVYVTANPRINRYEGQFHKIIPAWKTHWDEELKVVPPDILAELTVNVYEQFPEKRIVTHFMQPHIPFIGEFARSEIGIYDGTTKGRNRALGNKYNSNEEPYVLLERGDLDSELVKKAYKENLLIALPEVQRLLEELRGKSIVTADHGEMFGEVGWPAPFQLYGHPNRSSAKSLLQVPWLEYTNDTRRDTREEIVNDPNQNTDDDRIKDQLEHLGYR